MSMENDMTAKVLGEILAKGMSLAECNLEGVINSEAMSALKEVKQALAKEGDDEKKIKALENIIKEYEL